MYKVPTLLFVRVTKVKGEKKKICRRETASLGLTTSRSTSYLRELRIYLYERTSARRNEKLSLFIHSSIQQ